MKEEKEEKKEEEDIIESPIERANKDEKKKREDKIDEYTEELSRQIIDEDLEKHGQGSVGYSSIPIPPMGGFVRGQAPSPFGMSAHGSFIARIQWDDIRKCWTVIVPDWIIRAVSKGSKRFFSVNLTEVEVTGV